MTFMQMLRVLAGIPQHSAQELTKARQDWRDAIHENRNAQMVTISSAAMANKKSDKARERIEKVVERQESHLRQVQQIFLDRIKGTPEC